MKFPWNYYDRSCLLHRDYIGALENRVNDLIREGFTRFVCGGAHGVDMDFAETVIRFRDENKANIRLEIDVPCKNQSKLWGDEDKKRYDDVIAKADKVFLVSERYSPRCFDLRNRYMVDASELVLAFWNGEKSGGTYSTMSYARKKGKRLDVVRIPVQPELFFN